MFFTFEIWYFPFHKAVFDRQSYVRLYHYSNSLDDSKVRSLSDNEDDAMMMYTDQENYRKVI